MVSANKIEILRIAEAVAQEKMIDKSIVIEALEEAIAKAAKSNYGEENEVIVEINQDNGDISISRKMLVVDDVKNKFLEITLKAAKKINGAAQIGDQLLDPLPPLDFGRIAAQAAKQVINLKVREAERERQYNEYKDRVGEIVNGIVKRMEFGNIILDLGKAEGVIRKDQTIPIYRSFSSIYLNFRDLQDVRQTNTIERFVKDDFGYTRSVLQKILNARGDLCN